MKKLSYLKILYCCHVDITKEEILEKDHGFERWLKPLVDFVKKNFEHDYDRIRTTKLSVKFRLKDIIDVNLLVSPYWESKSDFYNFLKSIDKSDRNR